MKAIVTGMNGTVAPAFAEVLAANNINVVPWDREKVPIDALDRVRLFLSRESPDWFFHIATGPSKWAETVAGLCAGRSIKFLFTGSVSVFSGKQHGLIAPEAAPDATDEYGRYKIECEKLIRAANPDAIIARLGWQIGGKPGSNNMITHMQKQMRETGVIEASKNSFPSCAYLGHTAQALLELMQNHAAGTYHLEGNPGLNLFEISEGLRKKHHFDWRVKITDEPRLDNRMVDERIRMNSVKEYLGIA